MIQTFYTLPRQLPYIKFCNRTTETMMTGILILQKVSAWKRDFPTTLELARGNHLIKPYSSVPFSCRFDNDMGKREPYNFGVGKRLPYNFGVGKRAPYNFGVGKRRLADLEKFYMKSMPYNFGVGR